LVSCKKNYFDSTPFQGGLSSGYKKSIAEKGLPDESYTADSIALFRISGTSVHNDKAVQVDAVCGLIIERSFLLNFFFK